MRHKQNCLITGGAGFIGSHLCDRLLQEGWHVTAIDDLSLGRMSNLSEALEHSDFSFVEGDILDTKLLDSVFRSGNFDNVFHLAANSDIQRGSAETDRDLNLTFLTTFRVLDAMRRFAVRDLVFASTSAIYGEVHENIDEDYGPLQPISFYGAAKLAAEAYISAYTHSFDLRAYVFRFPNVVGNRATHGVLYDFIKKLMEDPTKLLILGNGQQCKPYLHVDDLLEAIMFCTERMEASLNCINVGVDTATQVTRIAEIVVEQMGLPDAEFHYTGGERAWTGDVPYFQYNLDRITRLGWKARYSSDEAVRKSVQEIINERKERC